MIIVGCDPDSKKHGIAIYRGGKLASLMMANNVEIYQMFLVDGLEEKVVFSIEDACANNFVYSRNNKGGKAVTSKIAMGVGRCQQAQVELMRWLEWCEVDYVLHKPQKGNWAKNKAQFEKVTGWTSQSNKDTRSAAYFGCLALDFK